MSIGENIKMIREKRGYTTLDFAKRVGIPHRTLQQYESDIKIPTTKTLITIAETLNTTIDSLIYGESKVTIDNPFTVEEFRVVRDLIAKQAEHDTPFNTYNSLLDKADDTLSDMERLKRLHKFDYEPKERDIDTGNFFLMRRDRQHVSRTDLADACGVTSNVICEWESGYERPTRNHIPTLKKFLNLTDSEIRRYIYPDYRG